jgi:hypothetical protein
MNDIDLSSFVALRRHLKIAHHIPGRIRLKIGLGAIGEIGTIDSSLVDRVLGAIDGIKDARVNAAAGSVVVAYQPGKIQPAWWEILINGDEAEARNLLRRLLERELADAVAAARGS